MEPPTRVTCRGATILKVRSPGPIVGISLRPDFEVTPDDGFVGTHQLQPVRVTVQRAYTRIGRKAPASSVNRMPVSVQHPIGVLVLMPASRPSPETMPEHMIDLAERMRRHDMPVIHHPTKDHPVERMDQIGLCRRAVCSDNRSHLLQERMDVLP